MFAWHRWQSGDIQTNKNTVAARIGSGVKQGLELPAWDVKHKIGSGGTCVNSQVPQPKQAVIT